MSDIHTTGPQPAITERHIILGLKGFLWARIEEEAAREGLTVEELITFSVLYYLADFDSGRIARRASASPYRHISR